MRLLQSFTRSMLYIFLVTVAANLGSASSACAQVIPSGSVSNPNTADARAYATLFRRALLFEKMATDADSAGTPKPHLRKNLQVRFKLNNDDSASLLRYAQAWQSDTASLVIEATQLRQQFIASFPGQIIPSGVSAVPPADAAVIQAQIDTLTLRYRDLLRNTMRSAAYDALEAQLRQSFGVDVTSSSDKRASASAVAR